MASYRVLGIEGEEVEVNGTNYPAGVGHVIELSEEEAADALATSKIELVAEDEATGDSPEAAAPASEDAAPAPEGGGDAPAEEGAAAPEGDSAPAGEGEDTQ